MQKSKHLDGRIRRKRRIRKKIMGDATRPRLSVFRSGKHCYAQVIDDVRGVTLAAASTLSKGFEATGRRLVLAEQVGIAIGKACLAKQIECVVFDRNGYLYHGRVKAVAEGARSAGLKF